MIRTIKTRRRPDALVNDVRRERNSLGRRIYVVLLAAGAVAIVNYLVGDMVFLRADGLVVRDRTVIASAYLAELTTVEVREGDVVAAGQPLLTVQSAEMIDRLGQLSAREGELIARLSEIKVKARTYQKLKPIAEMRVRESATVVSDQGPARARGLITAASRDDAMSNYYEATQALVALDAEQEALGEELAALEAARANTRLAIERLTEHYADGTIDAPRAGTVVGEVPAPGLVVKPGDPILTLYSGRPYIVAFVPAHYLPGLVSGDRVRVTSGRISTVGTVDEVLPVAQALPPEFQRSFRPRDRHRMVRLKIDEAVAFPVLDKVRIRDCWIACG